MGELALQASLRREKGKGPSRRLRGEDLVPAVCYGPGVEPVHVTVSPKELEQGLRGERGLNTVIKMEIGDQEKRTVMVKDVQVHPVTSQILHVDFYEVSEGRPVRVQVPIVLEGKAIGTQLGGILQQVRREVDIECMPSLIPERIVIDVTSMEAGVAFHIKDLELAEGIKAVQDEQLTIFTISAPEEEEEEETEEQGE